MDLVIAVYNENINWIECIKNKRVFIYLKNPNRLKEIQTKFPTIIVEVLENIGRESHTYLYHICKYYNSLAKYTAFVQGNPFDHCNNIIELLRPNDLTPFGKIYQCDQNGSPDHSGLPLSTLYVELFEKHQTNFSFVAGAQFMVSRDLIKKYTLDKYKFLLEKHYSFEKFPWCMERFWIHMYI